MNLPADEAQFLSMFVKIMNAKKTIDIGVFTVYSLLTTSQCPRIAWGWQGKNLYFWQILATDVDKAAYELGLPYIKINAGIKHKINFLPSDAFSVLNDLVNSVR